MAHAYLDEHLGALAVGQEHMVEGAEAEHAVRVARLRIGEQILMLNGNGLRVSCEVTHTDKGAFSVKAVGETTSVERPHPGLHLVQALAKGGRDEQAIQTATELGAMQITPWQSERCVVRWNAQKEIKQVQRWQQIVREASKQSLRAFMPTVNSLANTSALCELAARTTATVLVLDPTATESLLDIPLTASDEYALIVGPEGGISDAELAALASAGAIRVRLGSGIMRTSTAGPAAIAALHTRQGTWDTDR